MNSEPIHRKFLTREVGRETSLQDLAKVNSWNLSEDDEGGLNLGHVLQVLRQRLGVVTVLTVLVTGAAILKGVGTAPIYESKFEILTKPVTGEDQVISTVPGTLGSNDEQNNRENRELDQTKLKLLKSPKLLAPIVGILEKQYPELDYDSLAKELEVTSIPDTEVLVVTYRDENPKKVQAVLNLLSDTYLKYSLETKLSDIQQGTEFVNSQLPLLQKRVKDIQDTLQSFRQKYNLIDPESSGQQLTEQISIINRQQLENKIQLNQASTIYSDIRQQLVKRGDRPLASSAIEDNARYQNLLNRLLEIDSQIAKESTIFLEEAPSLKNLREEKQKLLILLQQEGQQVVSVVDSKVRELRSQGQVLNQTANQLNQRVKQLSTLSRLYNDIQAELKISTDNLNQFLAKRAALRIDAGIRNPPWQILSPVSLPIPTTENIKQNAVLGAILGLLMGIGVALGLEKMNTVLRTLADVKETTNLPLLASIPFNSDLQATKPILLNEKFLLESKANRRADLRSTYYYGASTFFEAFRSLLINLRSLNPESPLRSLVITSPSAGDGKTTLAVFLAQAAAASGQRVLLVDADLRAPKLQTRLQLEGRFGLRHLVSFNYKLEDVVQRLTSEPNLFVLTAGSTPLDPIRLLSSNKMRALMDQFTEQYDLVIYDSPPVRGLSDSKFIATHTDGLILALGLKKTTIAELNQAFDELRFSSARTLGIVANETSKMSRS